MARRQPTKEERYREQEIAVPFVDETFLGRIVEHALRSNLAQSDLPEYMERDARHYAETITAGIQAARNAPNWGFVLNLAFAALNLGLRAAYSREEIEALGARGAVRNGARGREKNGAVRKENRAWTLHRACRASLLVRF